MRKLIALIAVVVLLGSIAAFGATLAAGHEGDRARAAATTVRVGDNFFSPKSVRVAKGTRIRFNWVGDRRHNVARLDGSVIIRTRRSGVRSATFNRSRTVICTIHPNSMRMKITIRR